MKFEDYFIQHREAYKDAGFWGARKAYDVAVKCMLDDLAQKVEELEKWLTKLEKVERLLELQITINKQFDEAITKLEEAQKEDKKSYIN